VGEFRQTSLLMLAASILPSDPWVMAASSGAVTLTPLRMLSPEDRHATSEVRLLLDLADLGYVGRAGDPRHTRPGSPPTTQTEIVLLLPWSMISAVAELDLSARTSTRELSKSFAPEDWIVTWHHFIDGTDWELEADTVQRTNVLRALPLPGLRHFVLCEKASELSTNAEAGGGVPILFADGVVSGRGEPSFHGQRGRHLDPLAFTNQGGPPDASSSRFGDRVGRVT
jgi:hypothetical protein